MSDGKKADEEPHVSEVHCLCVECLDLRVDVLEVLTNLSLAHLESVRSSVFDFLKR